MKKKGLDKNIIKGRWYNINKKIKKKITAKYHKIKDWRMDPKGYFLIAIDKNKKIIRVGYCKFSKLGNSPIHDMVAEVKGKTAIEIVNTLIKEKFISTLQHAADMGIELHKAEMSLKCGFKYVQDKEIKIKKNN
jgi:dihydropteroate synthase